MSNGTRPHDLKPDVLESMRTLSLSHCSRGCPSLLYVTQPAIADRHVPSRRAAWLTPRLTTIC